MNNTTADSQFDALLDYLNRNRGFDFTGYKHASLARRIEKRMQAIDVLNFADYIDYLEVHPDEFGLLFNTILINVTGFFRDSIAWDFVASDIVPRILGNREPNDSIRVWSAGCASGQEAYTLAILFAEALGIDVCRERVKIYATDIDDEALAQSRQATYSTRDVIGVPAKYLEKYFEWTGNRYVLHKDLRRMVIFGRHDILKDAPISRIDLLICRNVLMYFNVEMQAQVLNRFHFALNDDGCLFLGKAEMLFTYANLFVPLDLKRRIFAKVSKGIVHDRPLRMASMNGSGSQGIPWATVVMQMRDQVFETGAIAQVVIEPNGILMMANERARSMFRLSSRDIGRVLQDLELSYRPVELRSQIEQAYAERRTIDIKEVLWSGLVGSEQVYLDVQLIPLFDEVGNSLGISVTFAEVTRYKRLQQQLEESNRELETAYEELQSTNEELETTNEELQSTVEELETTNEELQSTNEELETMNEELQSTNEELQTINEELQTRSAELNSVNAFLGAILSSFRGGVIVLDREMRIQVWNQKSEDLWGLRSQEVHGNYLLNLDMGLPAAEITVPIRNCLTGVTEFQEVTVNATNRRGRSITCTVSFTPLIDETREIMGAIVVFDDDKTEDR